MSTDAMRQPGPGMTPRREWNDITNHSENDDMIEPIEQNDAMENAQTNEPIEPIDSAEPTHPIDRIDPSTRCRGASPPTGSTTSNRSSRALLTQPAALPAARDRAVPTTVEPAVAQRSRVPRRAMALLRIRARMTAATLRAPRARPPARRACRSPGTFRPPP